MNTAPEITTFIQVTRACAMQMLSNASYILRELPGIEVPPDLRSKIEGVCDSLISTKHDVITELFELDELAQASADEERLSEKMARISTSLCEPLEEIHQVATEVQTLAASDIRYGLLFFLIIESATNIINSVPAELLDAEEQDTATTE